MPTCTASDPVEELISRLSLTFLNTKSLNASLIVCHYQRQFNWVLMPLSFHKLGELTKIVNAQWHLRGKATVPLSVRLQGSLHVSGNGKLVLGEGVSFAGTVVPIEL